MLSKVLMMIFPVQSKKIKQIDDMHKETTEQIEKMVATINHDTDWFKHIEKESK